MNKGTILLSGPRPTKSDFFKEFYMNKSILLLNGPKSCGKSVLIEHLQKDFTMINASCKHQLIPVVAQFFGISLVRFYELYNSRATKEVPTDIFRILPEAFPKLREVLPDINMNFDRRYVDQGRTYICLSPREAMIFVSEVIMKPSLGKSIFGERRAQHIRLGSYFTSDSLPLFYDDSAAFVEELDPLIKSGANILLLRLHRNGYEFDGSDSRGRIPYGLITNTIDVDSGGPLHEYIERATKVVKDWYSKNVFIDRLELAFEPKGGIL